MRSLVEQVPDSLTAEQRKAAFGFYDRGKSTYSLFSLPSTLPKMGIF